MGGHPLLDQYVGTVEVEVVHAVVGVVERRASQVGVEGKERGGQEKQEQETWAGG
jgi:hypothetical protein